MAWAKIPSKSIRDAKLKEFSWSSCKSDATAALILLIALSICSNRSNRLTEDGKPQDGYFGATYDVLGNWTWLSRIKISNGLQLLKKHGLILIRRVGRKSEYQLSEIHQPGHWAQLPQTYLTRDGAIRGFSKYKLRSKSELNALKLYLVILSYRDSRDNTASISYTRACEVTGMTRGEMSTALSHLIADELIVVSQKGSSDSGVGHPHNRYRVCGINSISSSIRHGT
jgi:hypothetical protein